MIKIKLTKFIPSVLILLFPVFAWASTTPFDYVPLEKIPGSTLSATADFYEYIQAVYKFGIWAVGIAALLMISIGAFMYITSAGNNASMEKAKGVIMDALIGLVLALTAYLLLYIINPDLVKISKLPTAAPLGQTPTVPPVTPPGESSTSCSSISSQVPNQCKDASPALNSLLSCVSGKTGGKIQISSISDGHGGVNCYKNNPAWGQCPAGDPNCCYHTKTSCHYGGTCTDGSHAVDFSNQGSVTPNSEIKTAIIACGGRALDEGNHVHGSIGSCGCDTRL